MVIYMRTLKENFFGNLGIGKVAKIEEWLKKYKIKNYTINSDFTIDVNGDVDLEKYTDKELPEYIQFNYVKTFYISHSNIISLRGCPKECKEDFRCSDCEKLISLEGAPEKCEEFDCMGCTNLTSLEGAPEKCDGFYCQLCKNLTSLEGAPKECKEFCCDACKNLTSLEGAPKECVKFDCEYCDNLTSLEGAPKECESFNCRRCKGKFTKEDVLKVCKVKKIKCD